MAAGVEVRTAILTALEYRIRVKVRYRKVGKRVRKVSSVGRRIREVGR